MFKQRLFITRNQQEFLTAHGKWTRKLASAKEFTSVIQAIRWAKELDIQNVQLYCSFGDGDISRVDFIIPSAKSAAGQIKPVAEPVA